jgi:ATP-dependent DNA helicase RecQ
VALAFDQETLFQALRAWRAATARERGVPAYVVFHDSTLRALAASRPGTIDDLRGITGIGQAKLDAYGDALLAVLASAPAHRVQAPGALEPAGPHSDVTSGRPPVPTDSTEEGPIGQLPLDLPK